MFDIGGWEFLFIVVLAIIVIGPKDLPGAIRSVTQWVRRARALARDFQSGLDEIARETELDKVEQEIRRSIDADGLKESANSIRRDIENTVDPDNDIRNAFADEDHFLDEPDEFDASPEEAEDEEIRRIKAERQRRLADERGRDETPSAVEDAPDDLPDDGKAPAPKAGTGS